MPVNSKAMPTMMLKIESISDMKPMSSAVASAVSVTQMLRALFEIGSPFSSCRGRLRVVRADRIARVFSGLILTHLGVGQPAGVRQRVLAHDLRLCERLSARVDRLASPVGSVLCNRRVFDRPEA